MLLVDVHAHLDLKEFGSDLDEVMNRAEKAGVKVIINNGLSPESNRKTLELSKKYKILKPALGLYPDDTIKLTQEQIRDEIIGVINLTERFYKLFGFNYNVELSTRPENSMGSDEIWEKATKGLKDALEYKKMPYKINEGDGAFYGPKIDFHLKDCLGRTWQCGTIQLDFAMPEKFDLTYDGKDGKKHRPIMVHRTIYGSIERFIGILIEHYAGKFPLWLSPVQVIILNINDSHIPYGIKLRDRLIENGFRVETDFNAETIPKKVRDAQLKRIPIIITIGDKEVNSNTVAVRTLDGKVRFGVPIDKLIKSMSDAVENKTSKITI